MELLTELQSQYEKLVHVSRFETASSAGAMAYQLEFHQDEAGRPRRDARVLNGLDRERMPVSTDVKITVEW